MTVLDDVRAWLARFIVPTSPGDLDALALWAAHTHTLDRAGASMRLVLTSAFPESGKTTALEHLERLTRDPVLIANAPTPAYAARVAHGRTLLVDEADTHVGGKGDAGELFGIINAGYRPSGTYGVLAKDPESGEWVASNLPVFGAVALAGIAPDLPAAFLSRCLVVHLSPDVDGEADETVWEDIGDEADDIGRRLAAWASTVELVAGETMPEGVKGRMRELWRPFKRLANAAGGDWPERCDALMRRVLEDRDLDREEGINMLPPHVMIVRDIFGVWHIVDPEGDGFAATVDIVSTLRKYSPEVWGDERMHGTPLTRQRLAKMLTKQGIRSTREGSGERRRGYERAAFHRAWKAIGIEPDRVILLPSDVA